MNNEEPKQIKCYCGHTIMCDCSPLDEPKQETLEEAAEKIYPHHKGLTTTASNKIMLRRCAWIKGAKWQQERSYSEEDLRKAWEDGRNNVKTVGTNPFVISKFQYSSFNKWFEQFKKN